ncbi:F-box domain-containing protein [Colletotrichum sojae]|uniref:F-box domain-containing protein n=1 Tax=Colletotrichum sojae TaxID=2175907 RepID=A0A8H6N300_9PEZI|nr:F-box domain-containing protein [Colletotrichum sojae]
MQRLPIEIMTYITSSLDLHDIFNLSLTCRQFNYLVANEEICRIALQNHAPYSAGLETARSAKAYARYLRRLVKTRDAIATAKPYSAAFVSCADDFIYCNGMLCYTVGPEVLRLLDLHNSASVEDVIGTRALLRSIPGESFASGKYKFRPIHYSNDIVSCLYTPPKTEGRSHLIVVDTRQRKVLTDHRLDSAHKLFVRNNRDYLYYGTHSMTGDDGFKRWVLKRFDFQEEKWNPGQLDLQDLVGSDVGSTVCFEIIDGYFYGISSLTTFEVYETDWTSYYYGFRFPVESSRPRDMELMSKTDMWRRQHEDGPIDDRWSTLTLGNDPVTGKLMAVECRREWLVNDCSSTRTIYQTEVKFSDGEDEDPSLEDQSDNQNDNRNDVEVIDTPPSNSECSTAEQLSSENRRNPRHVHRGDSGCTTPTITLTHCYIRSYDPSCETFIDLVNDPAAAESMAQRPQLRSISRFSPGGPRRPSVDGSVLASHQHHEANRTSWWLPEAEASDYTLSLHALDNILNPRGKSYCGSISGVMDDRSMVYAVGQRGSQGKRPLVFISFDPAIRLLGLDHWPGGPVIPPHSQKQPDPADLSNIGPYPTPKSMPASAPASRNASFCEGRIPVPPQLSTDPEPSVDKSEASVWGRETAMYVNSSRSMSTPIGFNFAYCGDHRGPDRYRS